MLRCQKIFPASAAAPWLAAGLHQSSREMPAFPHCAAVLQLMFRAWPEHLIPVSPGCLSPLGLQVCSKLRGACVGVLLLHWGQDGVCLLPAPATGPAVLPSSSALLTSSHFAQAIPPVCSARSRGSPCCREQPQPCPRSSVSWGHLCQQQDATVCCSPASWKGEQGVVQLCVTPRLLPSLAGVQPGHERRQAPRAVSGSLVGPAWWQLLLPDLPIFNIDSQVPTHPMALVGSSSLSTDAD